MLTADEALLACLMCLVRSPRSSCDQGAWEKSAQCHKHCRCIVTHKLVSEVHVVKMDACSAVSAVSDIWLCGVHEYICMGGYASSVTTTVPNEGY